MRTKKRALIVGIFVFGLLFSIACTEQSEYNSNTSSYTTSNEKQDVPPANDESDNEGNKSLLNSRPDDTSPPTNTSPPVSTLPSVTTPPPATAPAPQTPTVTSVTVAPGTASVQRGNTRQFTATVVGTNNPATTVTWTVSGGGSGTSISANGLLTIGVNETATTLTVRATSTVNSARSGTATVTVTVPPPVQTQPNAMEAEVLRLVNIERENEGLAPLQWNAQLGGLARAHSMDMYTRNFMAHTCPSGITMRDRFNNAGIRWSRIAENVAGGHTSAQQVVTAWMNSPEHRANILNPYLTYIGVGFYNNRWTQKFVTLM